MYVVDIQFLVLCYKTFDKNWMLFLKKAHFYIVTSLLAVQAAMMSSTRVVLFSSSTIYEHIPTKFWTNLVDNCFHTVGRYYHDTLNRPNIDPLVALFESPLKHNPYKLWQSDTETMEKTEILINHVKFRERRTGTRRRNRNAKPWTHTEIILRNTGINTSNI